MQSTASPAVSTPTRTIRIVSRKSQLALIQGQRAFIVTDPVIQQLGFVTAVQEQLRTAGLDSQVFAEVEPDPSLQTVRRGAAQMLVYQPDWIIGLGGGSSMDAA